MIVFSKILISLDFLFLFYLRKKKNEKAHQCPFTDGAVVYNARALYNLVNETVVVYNDNNCAKRGFSFREIASGDSTTNNMSIEEEELLQKLVINETQTKQTFKPLVKYVLYPNPAQNYVNINSYFNNETVKIKIRSSEGKLLLQKDIVVSNNSGKLDLDLINGIYFVNLTNEQGVKTVKKLVITK